MIAIVLVLCRSSTVISFAKQLTENPDIIDSANEVV